MDRGAWRAAVHRGAKSQTKQATLDTYMKSSPLWEDSNKNGGRSFPCSRNCCRAEKANILFYLLDEPDPEIVT